MIKKLLPHPALTVTLIIVWMLLANSLTVGGLVLGVIVGVVVPILTSPFWPDRPKLRFGPPTWFYLGLVTWDIITASFMAERDRLAAILKAVTITIRPKPKRGKDDTPPDVVSPALEAFRLVTIAGALRADLEHVRWHLFIGQALQVYHVALWESGRWTVIPGREVKPEDVEDLEPGWMKGEPPL